ncbi:hypothetical protein IFM89_003747 [Coptis chinensis]|uniref:Uncharacterized protein n=1 Tax=Coptis chinensis TaxID=261450 RepID=A0A835I9N0_9MAGN|nr:hypothetical protein IFM89_003747 [Coptis chinensis]
MLLPTLSRAVNVDYIGPSGLQDDVHISQPVDATLSYTPYPQRECEVDALDNASNWTVPITLQNGQIIHHHIELVGRESVPQLPISDQLSRVKMKAMLEDVLHANASKARVISHISNGMYSTSGDVIRAFNDTIGHSSPEDQHTHSQASETHMTPPGGVYTILCLSLHKHLGATPSFMVTPALMALEVRFRGIVVAMEGGGSTVLQ